MAEAQMDLKNLLSRLRQEHNAAWLYGVLERHEEAVLIVDQRWKLYFANPAARRLLEFYPEYAEGTRFLVIRPRNKSFDYPVSFPIETEQAFEFHFSENEWAGELAYLIRVNAPSPAGSSSNGGLAQYFANSWQCWIDSNQQIQFVSPNVLQLTGYPASDFQTMPNLLISLVHPEDRQRFRQFQEEQFDKTEPSSMEVRIINRHGETRWFQHVCQPAFDEDGHRIGLYESYQDITEFKTAYDESHRIQAILETVGFAGQQLLTTAWRSLIPDLLARLGESTQADRVSLLANVQREGSVVLRRQYGWHAADLAPELTAPPFKTGPLESSGLSGWEEPLNSNQPVQAHVRKLPPHQRAILQARNIQSTLAVPVFSGPDWWGFIQFDSIRAERTWSQKEINALQAFANVLGSTIQRERTEDDIRVLVEKERKQAQLAWALREVSLALNAVLDEEVVLDRLLSLLNQVVAYDFGSIILVDSQSMRIVRSFSHNDSSQVTRLSGSKSIRLNLHSALAEISNTKKPVLIADTTIQPKWHSPEGKTGVTSWMGAPVILEDEIVACISLNRLGKDTFTPEDLERLIAFNVQAARALQNARLFDEVAETLVHEQRLNEIAQIISSSLDLSTVLQTILRLTSQLVTADMGCLMLLSEHQDYLHIAHTYNTPDVEIAQNLKRGQGVSWRVIENSAAIMLPEYGADPQSLSDWKNMGVRAYLAVPLVAGKEILGGLNLFRTTPDRNFKERDRFLAEMVARQAGIAIQNARRFEEAQHLATRDSLTGLFNRRYFFEMAAREYERARRYDRPISAILLDLDNLKQINDTCGHQTGDLALQKVAQLCIFNLRRPDLIGRYGGDEYVMLLPETPLANALSVAERLRTEIKRTPLEVEGQRIALSVSIGVATLRSDTRSLETLIDQADQAQYESKHSGKDQVRAWGFDKD